MKLRIPKRIINFKLAIIIVLLAIILALFFIGSTRKRVSFELDDRCGPIMNMISHSIKDESVCRSKCLSQCNVKDLRFRKVEFYENPRGCNNCTCFCK